MQGRLSALVGLSILLTLGTSNAADRAAAEKLVAEASDSSMLNQREKVVELCTQAAAREQLAAGLANAQPQEIKEVVAATQAIQKEHADAGRCSRRSSRRSNRSPRLPIRSRRRRNDRQKLPQAHPGYCYANVSLNDSPSAGRHVDNIDRDRSWT